MGLANLISWPSGSVIWYYSSRQQRGKAGIPTRYGGPDAGNNGDTAAAEDKA